LIVSRLCLAPSLLLLAACGASAPAAEPAKAPPPAESGDVERYLPLRADTVLAFDTVDEQTGERGAVMMQVRRPRLGLVELDVGGRVQRLSLDPNGARLVTGGWLLKAPLIPGARFKGQFGEVEVTSLTAAVQVPAGRFSGCLQTVEQSNNAERKVTTVFCPDVGITLLEVEGSTGEGYGRVRSELRSYGPRVNIDAM
jgi:hypothetical protein